MGGSSLSEKRSAMSPPAATDASNVRPSGVFADGLRSVTFARRVVYCTAGVTASVKSACESGPAASVPPVPRTVNVPPLFVNDTAIPGAAVAPVTLRSAVSNVPWTDH